MTVALWVSLALAQAPGAEAYVEVVPVGVSSGARSFRFAPDRSSRRTCSEIVRRLR